MKIRRAYKFRLCPTEEQAAALRQHGGNARFLWNKLLELNQARYALDKKFIFSHDMIVGLPKMKQDYPFLQESFSQSLQQVARHLDSALKSFFKRQTRFPVRKTKKKMNDSFTVPQKFRIEKNYVFIPKVGEVKWIKHRPIKGLVKHLTISQDGEQWYCSVNVELKIRKPVVQVDPEKVVGIDVGLKTFATLSDGSKIENPHLLKKHEQRLKRYQRRLSKRQLGSNNRNKQRIKVQKQHRKLRDARRDFQHKTTHAMITKYDGFVLEDLNIKGMMRNHHLAKSISDCAWFEWKRQLRYKSEWAGKWFGEVDRFEPTSKKCSGCGWLNKELKLSDREFICLSCGQVMDRDENAATNIRNIGMKIPQDVREYTLGETGGFRAAAQCQSLSQEKEPLGLGQHLCCVN